jgi:hypothetical protein
VVVIVFASSLFGLLIDVFTGNGVGWIFGVVFIAASCYAAFQVRRADVGAAIITPPLVFALLVMTNQLLASPGPLLTKVVAGMNGLLDDGPMLWIGAGLAVVIVVYRVWQERRPPRQAAAPMRAAAPTQVDDAPVWASAPAPAAAAGPLAEPPPRPLPEPLAGPLPEPLAGPLPRPIPMPSDPAS